jgi:hypothetical protein
VELEPALGETAQFERLGSFAWISIRRLASFSSTAR